MTRSLTQLRSDLHEIVRAALDAVDAGALVRRALVEPSIARVLNDAAAVHVIAAGKAASVMLDACVSYGVMPRTMLGIGPAEPEVDEGPGRYRVLSIARVRQPPQDRGIDQIGH